MEDLLLHERTAQDLTRYLKEPTQALLLVASEGSGKATLASFLAGQLSNTPEEKLDLYPYLRIIKPEKDKAISIESVRELKHFNLLKMAKGKNYTKRIIVIQDAQTMTLDAQNAVLKILEEPPEDTFFILTATSEQQVLPTIRSRVQILYVRTPSQSEVENYFNSKHTSPTLVRQTYFLSGGLPGLMHALLYNEEHPLKSVTELARILLRATTYERLCHVDELSKQKTTALQLIFVLKQMAEVSLTASANKQETAAIKRWHKILKTSYDTEALLLSNAQSKLVLTNLMLNL